MLVMTLACPRSLSDKISGQCGRASDPGKAPAPAVQLLMQVFGQEGDRLQHQPVRVGEKDLLSLEKWIRAKVEKI